MDNSAQGGPFGAPLGAMQGSRRLARADELDPPAHDLEWLRPWGSVRHGVVVRLLSGEPGEKGKKKASTG